MIVLLLSDPSACLRYRVASELLPEISEDELRELEQLRKEDPLVTDLVSLQQQDGSWVSGDGAWRSRQGSVLMTSYALHRLGTLGFDSSFEPIGRGAEYLFSRQRKDGAWPLGSAEGDEDSEGLSLSPMQTALPLRSLTRCGYAMDVRCNAGFEWLMRYRLDDGAWPTGYARDNLRRVAGYRRLAHSEWGCRANTTAVLQSLVYRPDYRAQAGRALDLLLGRETREAHVFGYETARMLGAEPVNGFITFFARFDVGLILELAATLGASPEDERIADAIRFVEELRGPHGLWEYAAQPQCSRWVTFATLLTLQRLDTATDRVTFEPRTPFQPYRPEKSRF